MLTICVGFNVQNLSIVFLFRPTYCHRFTHAVSINVQNSYSLCDYSSKNPTLASVYGYTPNESLNK